jgi:hypothetical protein
MPTVTVGSKKGGLGLGEGDEDVNDGSGSYTSYPIFFMLSHCYRLEKDSDIMIENYVLGH